MLMLILPILIYFSCFEEIYPYCIRPYFKTITYLYREEWYKKVE